MKRAVLSLLTLLTALVGPAVAGDGTVVRLSPGAAGSRLAPRYSPKGTRVKLAPLGETDLEGLDHLRGRMQLGPKNTRGEGRLIVLARSAAGKPFDLLWLDKNGSGSVDDDEESRAVPRKKRGSFYTSYAAEVRVNHGSREKPAWEPYTVGLWVVVEAEDAKPEFIRYSRRGYLAGPVSIGQETHQVVLSDANNDAVFGTGDWWAILPSAGDRTNGIGDSRKVGDFAWIGRRAYKFEIEGTAGRVGRIEPFDPGLTPEEDARKRDPYWDDKHAERAEAALVFAREVDDAIKDARARKAPYFLDFETEWCGPCKSMDRWVYTARDVVAAANGIVCIKVDGDERKDLKDLHKVGSFPTGILFGPDGKEIARFSGYQTGTRMAAFFARVSAGK